MKGFFAKNVVKKQYEMTLTKSHSVSIQIQETKSFVYPNLILILSVFCPTVPAFFLYQCSLPTRVLLSKTLRRYL